MLCSRLYDLLPASVSRIAARTVLSLPALPCSMLSTAEMLLPHTVINITSLVQAPEGVKKVVCASNPTSKICLKNSYMKKETGGSSR